MKKSTIEVVERKDLSSYENCQKCDFYPLIKSDGNICELSENPKIPIDCDIYSHFKIKTQAE